MAKVSIIVPVYNAEKCIGRCIDSVLKQDYQDWELILLNDGSKDGTAAILDEYGKKDERIRVVHKTNSGVSATRNMGLSLAKGQYIQFMDADDWLSSESTKLMVREMEENQVDMVIGDFYRVIEDNVSKKGSIDKSGVLTIKEYADQMMLSPADFYFGVLWNKLYKRELIEQYQIQMDSNISFCEDMIFNLEYLLHVGSIYVLKAPVYYYVKTKGSLVDKAMNIESVVTMKKNVITYYNNFYKNVLNSQDYLERMPIIYGYLIAVSTDGISIPFFNSKKLGKESGTVYLNEQMEQSLLFNNYLNDMMLQKFLFTFSQQYDLDLKETKILYCLKCADQPLSLEEISAYTEIPVSVCVVCSSKLLAKGYIRREKLKIYLDNEEMANDLGHIQNDCIEILCKGFSQQEREILADLQHRVICNMMEYLKK